MLDEWKSINNYNENLLFNVYWDKSIFKCFSHNNMSKNDCIDSNSSRNYENIKQHQRHLMLFRGQRQQEQCKHDQQQQLHQQQL